MESKGLSDIPVTDVQGVIDLLRVSMGRFMEAYTQSLQVLDYEDRLAAFRILALSSGSLASMVRIQIATGQSASEANEIINQLKELGDLDEPGEQHQA